MVEPRQGLTVRPDARASLRLDETERAACLADSASCHFWMLLPAPLGLLPCHLRHLDCRSSKVLFLTEPAGHVPPQPSHVRAVLSSRSRETACAPVTKQ